ncbi:MAG: diacylglycerol kinase family lipid kinase, partial [Candidatus Aminicenantes bacterium]
MKILVILNSLSGNGTSGEGESKAAEIADAFRAAGIDAHVKSPEVTDFSAFMKQVEMSHFDAVVAAGGDGTVGTVAGGLAGTSTPLGILPLGTLNHFAKDLKIPFDLKEAVLTIAAGKT